jgi:glycosyltransferase involved in cell wall biosynthesis
MRVGFGVTVLQAGLVHQSLDGIGVYTQSLLDASTKAGLDVVPVAFDRHSSELGSYSVEDGGRFRLQAALSLTTGLAFPQTQNLVNQKNISLFHATDHLIPRIRKVPVVATVMDAIPLSNPEWVGYRFKKISNEAWRRSVHWADHVITISEYSKQEIIRWFRYPADRISVTPLAVDERWQLPPLPERLAALRSRYDLPEGYFLCVGTLQPRKNTMAVIRAHKRLPPALRKTHPLVVVGRPGWQCDDVVAALQTDPLVKWLQNLPTDDLIGLTGMATALVNVSLSEGFGLPVLEAFAAGAPVIASNTTSLPEVAGKAALLVSPLDTDAISQAMEVLALDMQLRATLMTRGRERIQQFSIAETTRRTVAVYMSVCRAW